MNIENSNFQYPNLADDIDILKHRVDNVSEEHKPLLEKWLEQLAKIHLQMRHLERIESFSSALTDKEKSDDS